MTDAEHTPMSVDLSTVEGHCGFKLIQGGGRVAVVYADIVTSELQMDEHSGDPRNAESVERANRIVLTWNCHDELLEALESLVRATGTDALGEIEFGGHSPVTKARAAIAKARG